MSHAQQRGPFWGSQICITFNRSEGQIFMHFLCQTFRKSIGGSCICTVHHIGAQYMLTLAPQCTAFIFWGFLSFYLPSSLFLPSFPWLLFPFFPCFFPIFLFPVFCLHFLSSSFHLPCFYSPPYSFLPFSTVAVFWFVPIFYFLLCTPPLFLQFSLWLATFLGCFCYSSCSMWKTGSWEFGYFSLFHVLYMMHLPGKKLMGLGRSMQVWKL